MPLARCSARSYAVHHSQSMSDLPIVRSTQTAGFLCLLVWCKACYHQTPADLQSLIDSGRGDVPLLHLRFRCAQCGSNLTDQVVTSKDAIGVTPWRDELKPADGIEAPEEGRRWWEDLRDD